MATDPIQYAIELDIDRDYTFASPIRDITDYVIGNISASSGMADSFENVSQPSQMTFTISNRGREFDLAYRGAELLVNGDLSQWSGGLPVGWDGGGVFIDGVLLTEVDPSETFGGTGTGAANFRSPFPIIGDVVFITQPVFTPGHTYELNYDITASKVEFRLPNNFTPSGVIPTNAASPSTSAAIGPMANAPGHYRYIFRAKRTEFSIGSLQESGLDVTIDNLSIKETAPYAMVGKGMLVRLTATRNGITQTLFIGRITDMTPTVGDHQEHVVHFTCKDVVADLLEAEYQAPLLTNSPTADLAIAKMFDDPTVIAWPYERNYWMLGVIGSSELGISTRLYENKTTNISGITTLETGQTVFSYLGDRSKGIEGRADGTSALGYITDLTNAEFGRFYYDARNAVFRLHNRSHDTLNDASQVTQTFTAADLDTGTAVYANDLYNKITLKYTERTVGSSTETIWQATNTPFLLKGNTSKKITARYFDATNNTIKIAAKDYITPIAGTDYTANSASGGSGTDLSTAISVGVQFHATDATVYLSNSGSTDAFITLLRLRGTPLTAKDQTTDAADWDSVRDYDARPFPPQEIPLLDDPDLALNAAQWQVARFKDPVQRLQNIKFNSLRNENTMQATFDREIGDRITVQIPNDNHDSDYFIVGINYNITVGGDMPCDVQFILKPAARAKFWVLGVAGLSELGNTTILGF